MLLSSWPLCKVEVMFGLLFLDFFTFWLLLEVLAISHFGYFWAISRFGYFWKVLATSRLCIVIIIRSACVCPCMSVCVKDYLIMPSPTLAMKSNFRTCTDLCWLPIAVKYIFF